MTARLREWWSWRGQHYAVMAIGVLFIVGGLLHCRKQPPVCPETRERVAEKSATTEAAKVREVRIADVVAKADREVVTRWLPAPDCRGGVIVERVERDKGTTETKARAERQQERVRTEIVERVSERLVLREVRPRWSLGAGPSWSGLTLRPTGAVVTGGVRVFGDWWLKGQAGAGDGLRAGLMIERTW